jgi:hypothetical protein
MRTALLIVGSIATIYLMFLPFVFATVRRSDKGDSWLREK